MFNPEAAWSATLQNYILFRYHQLVFVQNHACQGACLKISLKSNTSIKSMFLSLDHYPSASILPLYPYMQACHIVMNLQLHIVTYGCIPVSSSIETYITKNERKEQIKGGSKFDKMGLSPRSHWKATFSVGWDGWKKGTVSFIRAIPHLT